MAREGTAMDQREPPPPKRYHAILNPYCRGEWKVEPTPYRGRGVVYFFRGRGAKKKATEWAKRKNSELQKV
jgi:hypothetical protein